MRWLALGLTLLAVCSVGLTTQPTSCPFKKAPSDNPNPGRGHNQPFGYHARQWHRIDTMYEHPSPEEFYEKYMRTSRPLVIRGGASQWPAIEKWRNLTYVGSNIDSHRAEINWKKMYDYDPYHPVRVRMRMDEFVKWVTTLGPRWGWDELPNWYLKRIKQLSNNTAANEVLLEIHVGPILYSRDIDLVKIGWYLEIDLLKWQFAKMHEMRVP